MSSSVTFPCRFLNRLFERKSPRVAPMLNGVLPLLTAVWTMRASPRVAALRK